ncbi:hypothetical protein L211DRAFT_851518 [Terfezia boudieri ATCC MYA-4762]|uniref:Uncharacterized protein n=1 Tax=Terfezia boudieri ATCC MYA-4762 TaxID=1051890 RepID=A0A3N4LI03_9PEZI|nr:hypothetical protein L211DRAFT_851518 [Terfezia boudieri ATCC MYA-4762]
MVPAPPVVKVTDSVCKCIIDGPATGAGAGAGAGAGSGAGAVRWPGLELFCAGDTGTLAFGDDIISVFFKIRIEKWTRSAERKKAQSNEVTGVATHHIPLLRGCPVHF